MNVLLWVNVLLIICENHDSRLKKMTKIPHSLAWLPKGWTYTPDFIKFTEGILHLAHSDTVNNAAIIIQRIVSLLICLKKSQEIQGISGKKSAIETRRSADYFLPQGSDGQDSTTHRHAHQAEWKNMLNIIDQFLFWYNYYRYYI